MTTNEEWLIQQGGGGTVRHVDELMSTALNLDGRSNPDAVAILIDGDVTRHMAKNFNVGGIDVSPKDAAAKVRADECMRDSRMDVSSVRFGPSRPGISFAGRSSIATPRAPG